MTHLVASWLMTKIGAVIAAIIALSTRLSYSMCSSSSIVSVRCCIGLGVGAALLDGVVQLGDVEG